jgi:hypothetical protein
MHNCTGMKTQTVQLKRVHFIACKLRHNKTLREREKRGCLAPNTDHIAINNSFYS